LKIDLTSANVKPTDSVLLPYSRSCFWETGVRKVCTSSLSRGSYFVLLNH